MAAASNRLIYLVTTTDFRISSEAIDYNRTNHIVTDDATDQHDMDSISQQFSITADHTFLLKFHGADGYTLENSFQAIGYRQ